jgi:glycosyltransferase involved in cell wall biosynthesis/ubiquinone/menaquinone biosynthesis C-methylase UbiE
MSRGELLTAEARPLVEEIDRLVRDLYARGLHMSAWIGSLPKPGEGPGEPQGMDQRLNYQPLPGAADDGRLPWFLYWEIFAVMSHTRPLLRPGVRLLDAGGASSLFSFYLASLGHEVHAIDLNEKLTWNARKVAKALGWTNLHSYVMNMGNLEFPDEYFDIAYSICVFEHLDYDVKQEALAEIARCLKMDGLLCITFDYKNPAPGVHGYGKDTRLRNRISTPEDIRRTFLETGFFDMAGNREFADNGESYLVHRRFGDGEYTFGSLFLRKVKHPERRTPAGAKRPALDPAALPPGPFLSVIICTYKRPALLRLALKSLLEQSLPAEKFEVIVVDNNSEDETEDLIREFAEKSPNIRCVREPKQGLSNSRNRGCEEARGDYLLYLDDDAKAHPDYLWNVYLKLVEKRPDILGGPIYPYYTSRKPAWFKDEYEIRLNAKESGWSANCRISGSNYVIRKDLLRDLGLFDPRLGMVGGQVRLGEEREVLNKYRATRPAAEQKVYYDLDCIVYHHVPREKMSGRNFLKRHYAAGRAKADLEGRTRERWGPLARAKFVGKSAWGRWRSAWRDQQIRTAVKQFVLERGAGFMYEVGRCVGCLPGFSPRRRKRGPRS